LKIYYFTRYPPGTGEDAFFAYWFARDLGKAGHGVCIVNLCREMEEGHKITIPETESDYLEPQNVEIFSGKRQGGGEELRGELRRPDLTDRLMNIAVNIIGARAADLILCSNFYPSGVVGLYTKLLASLPLIIANRGAHFSRLMDDPRLSRLIRETLRRADKIEIRERDMDYFLRLGVPKGKLSYLDVLVNPEHFTIDARPFDFSSPHGIDMEGQPMLTFIDSPEPSRKLHALIDAVSRVDEKLILCIQLNRAPEPLNDEISASVRSRGLEKKAIILPPQPPWRFSSLMKSSAFVIYPGSIDDYSSQQKFIRPPYLNEALLCGKCILLSRSVYHRTRFTHLKDGEHCVLFESNDDMIARIRSLVRNPERAEIIGTQARELVLRGNEYQDILREKLIMYGDVIESFSRLKKMKAP
jgi:glycosyltransferase involved in cell wall biosynthesis